MRGILLPLLLCASMAVHAGGDPLPMGARFAGMGWCGLTLTDVWSVRLNPAGIAMLETPVAGLSYQRHFLSEELAHQGLAVAVPLGRGVLGIGADRFGYSLYNETRGSLAYAMAFGDGLRAAVQMNYLGVRIGENYGSTGTMVAEMGMQARITDELWIGAHIYNPTRAALLQSTDGAIPLEERVPTLLRAGFCYTFSDKLLTTLEAEKDIDRPERFRFGLEYRPSQVLFIRTGLSTADVQAHFGAGLRLDKLEVDLAVAVRSMLGPTPMITLNYNFR